MEAQNMMPTIRRDVLFIYQKVKEARDSLDKRSEAWDGLDLAVPRLEALMTFIAAGTDPDIGPFPPNRPDEEESGE